MIDPLYSCTAVHYLTVFLLADCAFVHTDSICTSKPAPSFVFTASCVVRGELSLRTHAAYPQRAFELGRVLLLETARPLEYRCAPL